MTVHQTRDSLTGVNRKRLRGTLRVAMGVKSNADIFESKGNPWRTTELEERRNAVERAKLEQHLRQAKLTEQRFIGYLRDKLSDPGKPEPVRVDKQKLAEEKKYQRANRSCRNVSANRLSAAIGKATRLAALDKQLRANEAVKAKCSKFHKDYGHFTVEIENV
jgi:hypothetical protein